ncbi:MAG: phosphatidylinositol mannoside acyltransferase [Actinobacteria bacterium]|nr:phosphatidylinositol mannoside acyltransferase [Actinomycetota bacterium]
MAASSVALAYRLGSRAVQFVPWRMGEAASRGLGRIAGRFGPDRRRTVERHVRRVQGTDLTGGDLRRAVDDVFASYANYWFQSLRLPAMDPDEIDAGFTEEGFEHVVEAQESGRGVIIAMPHLGGWEWAGSWVSRVVEYPVAAVVEPLEPPELFEWFRDYRRSYGIEVIALGPDAGGEVQRALHDGAVVVLLSDRHVGGSGVDVEFFGEVTTLPAGPALLALRTGAALIPATAYIRRHGCHGVARPPVPAQRKGRFRDDVARVTQALAAEFEDLIRAEPEQWHLLQPNWPSDRVPAGNGAGDRG